jgi:hypothetical protein
MITKINSTMENIQKMGHSEAEYTHVFRLLNDSELALLEKMERLHALEDSELDSLYAVVNKIMNTLRAKFPKPGFAQLLSA